MLKISVPGGFTQSASQPQFLRVEFHLRESALKIPENQRTGLGHLLSNFQPSNFQQGITYCIATGSSRVQPVAT
jgi:hypothetical protein